MLTFTRAVISETWYADMKTFLFLLTKKKTSPQIDAHHYCSHLNDDLAQCVIYDSASPNARLIGIEYVISEKLFLQLPPEEQRLWHSHEFEVKGGLLTAPGIPQAVENQLMGELVRTFGKTFHTWQVDRHDFPFGVPQLMMAYTHENQVPQSWVQRRDAEERISIAHQRNERKHMKGPSSNGNADCWMHGKAVLMTSKDVDKV